MPSLDDPIVDLDADDVTPSALTLRRPDTPGTLTELAALKGEAVEVIEARVLVLMTLRKAAIRATSPEDWLLFKTPDEQGGQITGYLQDCGADRVRDLYGIEVFDVSRPERVNGAEAGQFLYLISASGRCKLTRQVLEHVEGGRSSTDDFCKGQTGAALELLVRKAARANVDGNITRELAGMKSVPVDDLKEAWTGTKKLVDRCRLGRGFGTRDERLGGVEAADLGLVPPTCNVCKKPMQLRKGSKGNFYSCADYKSHGRDAHTWDLEKWREQPASRKPVTAPTPASSEPLTADQVFGHKNGPRDPGEEG